MKKTIAILSLLLLLLLPLCLRADTASTTTVSNIIHSLVFALAPGCLARTNPRMEKMLVRPA